MPSVLTTYKIKIKAHLAQFVLRFKRFKVKDTIIVCGYPRSGTTWLLEIVSKLPKTCVHWEPFRQENGVVPKAWKWGDRIFIPKDEKNKQYHQLIKGVLNFKIFNEWTLEALSIKSLLSSKQVIVKFVRINLLLPYIVSHFKLKNQPILILRHPIDTYLSQMNAFSYYRDFPREIPDWLNNERYLKQADYLQSLSSAQEYNVAMWCINNCPLLDDKDTLRKLNLVFYSDLVLNPERETRQLFNRLTLGINQPELDKLISTIDFRKPSKTDFGENFIPDPEKQLQKNIDKLTAAEKHGIQRVFDHFGLKLYDAYSVFPNKDSL